MTMAVFISKTGALRPPSLLTTSTFRPSLRLTQQRQYVLRDLVGLCQYGSAGLLQDLRAGHVGHFHRVVGIFDARTGGSQVGFVSIEVGDGILKAVLYRTQLGAQSVHLIQSPVHVSQHVKARCRSFFSRQSCIAGFCKNDIVTVLSCVGSEKLAIAALQVVGTVVFEDGIARDFCITFVLENKLSISFAGKCADINSIITVIFDGESYVITSTCAADSRFVEVIVLTNIICAVMLDQSSACLVASTVISEIERDCVSTNCDAINCFASCRRDSCQACDIEWATDVKVFVPGNTLRSNAGGHVANI